MANQLKVVQLANASALAATTNYPFTADTHKVKSVQAVWTSTTASFTLTLQYSNDGTNWFNFASGQAVANNNGTVMWDVAGTKDGLYWQLNALRSSGTLTTLTSHLSYELRT